MNRYPYKNYPNTMNDEYETLDELINRRQYFRVVDRVSIEIAKIEEQQLAAEQFELLPEFGLISEFQLLDVESKHLLRALTDKDKNLGQYLKILNKKLDALARVISLNHQVIPKDSIQEVNLSEGGISLSSQQALNRKDKVAIKLILLPNYSGLVIEGKVLSCQKQGDQYSLHIEFLDITEAHQQLIARHIMRIQSQQKQQGN
ncbi:MAG: PilZ domain-containing protein [Oleiphilus sp.]